MGFRARVKGFVGFRFLGIWTQRFWVLGFRDFRYLEFRVLGFGVLAFLSFRVWGCQASGV